MSDSIDMARLMVAEKRIEGDREVALKQIEHKRLDEMNSKNWEHDQERMSSKRMSSFLDNIVGKGMEQFAPIIQTIIASKLAPKPDLGGGIPSQQEYAPPPQQYQAPAGSQRVTPEDAYRYRAGGGNYRAAAVTEGERLSQQAADQARADVERAAQQSVNQQNAWASAARPRSFSPADFSNYSDDQMNNYESQGQAWIDSAVSFNDALKTAKYERMIAAKRRGEQALTTPTATAAKIDALASPIPTQPQETAVSLDDPSAEEEMEDDDEASSREEETGEFEDSGVETAAEGDIV
jgi:hypothetical protein